MSSYCQMTQHPITKKWEMAIWPDGSQIGVEEMTEIMIYLIFIISVLIGYFLGIWTGRNLK